MPRKPKEEESVIDFDPEEYARNRAVNDQRVQDRIGEYEKDFEIESLTAVDRLQIRQLAQLELAAADATNELINAVVSPNMRKQLSDSAKALIAEARQLADALGMTRKRRMGDDGEDASSYIPNLAKDGYKFLSERAVAIVCPHCRTEKAHVEIKAGMILYHFSFEKEWQWKSKCPRCGEWFTIDQNNYLEFRFDTLGQYEEKNEMAEFDVDDETPMTEDEE